MHLFQSKYGWTEGVGQGMVKEIKHFVRVFLRHIVFDPTHAEGSK